MERTYANSNGPTTQATFFYGIEVEKTPAYGFPTLFVVGLQPVDLVLQMARAKAQPEWDKGKIKHIYLGANHSFNQDEEWATLIDALLHEGFWVTLDYPSRVHNFVMRILNQEMRHSCFIPMISIEMPNIEAFSYNAVIKIDDQDMDYSNPGVWCHSLHDLMDREKFTDWTKYGSDKVIK